MNFEFATAQRIVFGVGASRDIGKLATRWGKRALLVHGSSGERAGRIAESLKQAGVSSAELVVDREPTTHLAQLGVELARAEGCDLVVGIGGGSVLDAGKAIAALVRNPGDVIDYLEVIGKGKPIMELPLPYLALPTTAGTGTEVTRNAVLGSPEHGVKVSLRSELMLPRLALIDPELTLSLPPQLTASTGMDALTQLIEPYVSNAANPMIDAICREGMRRAARSLRQSYTHGDDLVAREGMSLAALFGGLALANARLGAVHGFAGPIGGMFDAPHGAVCGLLLPEVMQANIEADRLQDRANPVLVRYTEISRILTGDPGASALDGVAWVRELRAELGIPGLAAYGITLEHIPELIEKSARASSMKGNPVVLSEDQLEAILLRAL